MKKKNQTKKKIEKKDEEDEDEEVEEEEQEASFIFHQGTSLAHLHAFHLITLLEIFQYVCHIFNANI